MEVYCPEFKVVLVGDGGTGKTSFLNRYLTGEDLQQRYQPTGAPPMKHGVEVKSLTFNTSRGPIKFNVWDTGGQDRYCLLRDCYFIQATAAIIFTSVTDRASYRNAWTWWRDVDRVCQNIPKVIVGNKTDADATWSGGGINFREANTLGIPYCELSVKDGCATADPFLVLIRALTGDQTVQFVGPPGCWDARLVDQVTSKFPEQAHNPEKRDRLLAEWKDEQWGTDRRRGRPLPSCGERPTLRSVAAELTAEQRQRSFPANVILAAPPTPLPPHQSASGSPISFPTALVPTFKVLLCGDSGVGKTTFAKRHMTGSFEKKYIPTSDMKVRLLRFTTSVGPIDVQLLDVAGQEEAAGAISTECDREVDAAILMFDVTSRHTYKNLEDWYGAMPRVPTVLVGNKADVRDRKVKAHQITFHTTHGMNYYDMSVSSGYNDEKPFIWLFRYLMQNRDIKILERVSVSKRRVSVVTTLACLVRRREILYAAQRAKNAQSGTPSSSTEGCVVAPPDDGRRHDCYDVVASSLKASGGSSRDETVVRVAVCPDEHKQTSVSCEKCSEAMATAVIEAKLEGKTTVADEQEETEEREKEEAAKKKRKKGKRMLEGELAFTIITSDDVWRHILEFV